VCATDVERVVSLCTGLSHGVVENILEFFPSVVFVESILCVLNFLSLLSSSLYVLWMSSSFLLVIVRVIKIKETLG
jgi:hypothetical protein